MSDPNLCTIALKGESHTWEGWQAGLACGHWHQAIPSSSASLVPSWLVCSLHESAGGIEQEPWTWGSPPDGVWCREGQPYSWPGCCCCHVHHGGSNPTKPSRTVLCHQWFTEGVRSDRPRWFPAGGVNQALRFYSDLLLSGETLKPTAFLKSGVYSLGLEQTLRVRTLLCCAQRSSAACLSAPHLRPPTYLASCWPAPCALHPATWGSGVPGPPPAAPGLWQLLHAGGSPARCHR